MNEHECKQEDQIAKLNLLLLGNGNPANGFVFRVMDMSEHLKTIDGKLTGISGIVTELHEDSMRKKVSVKTDKEKKVERRAEWLKWVQTFAFVVGAIGLGITSYMAFKNRSGQGDIIKQVDNLGTPVVVRNREIVALPDGDSLKYFRNGAYESFDTIKK